MIFLQDSWIAQSAENTLVLASSHGRICRYRLRNGNLEYKAGPLSFWAVLSPDQTMQHFAIDTVVGKWLRDRLKLNARRNLRSQAA